MPKISALPPMTSADGDDEAPIVDDSVTTTKKFTLTLLKEWLQSLVGWIGVNMLSTSAISLGYAQITSNLAGLTTSSWVDLTGLSVTITAPTARKIRIEAELGFSSSTTSGTLGLRIQEGATVLQEREHLPGGTSIGLEVMPISIEFTASAGSHTYKLTGRNVFASGSIVVKGASTKPSYISVKAI